MQNTTVSLTVSNTVGTSGDRSNAAIGSGSVANVAASLPYQRTFRFGLTTGDITSRIEIQASNDNVNWTSIDTFNAGAAVPDEGVQIDDNSIYYRLLRVNGTSSCTCALALQMQGNSVPVASGQFTLNGVTEVGVLGAFPIDATITMSLATVGTTPGTGAPYFDRAQAAGEFFVKSPTASANDVYNWQAWGGTAASSTPVASGTLTLNGVTRVATSGNFPIDATITLSLKTVGSTPGTAAPYFTGAQTAGTFGLASPTANCNDVYNWQAWGG